jgi:hypothetical protein
MGRSRCPRTRCGASPSASPAGASSRGRCGRCMGCPRPHWPSPSLRRGRGARTLGVDATVLASQRRAVEGSRQVVSVGRPVPGFEVEVRNELGHVAPERHVGRVFLRGPSVMQGYFGRPDATAQALSADGWLDTGTWASRRTASCTSRPREGLVIIRGANHAPQEFEECLEAVEGLRTGCAVALGFTPEGESDEALLVLAELASAEAVPEGLEERCARGGGGGHGHPPAHGEAAGARDAAAHLERQAPARRGAAALLAGELTAPKQVGHGGAGGGDGQKRAGLSSGRDAEGGAPGMSRWWAAGPRGWRWPSPRHGEACARWCCARRRALRTRLWRGVDALGGGGAGALRGARAAGQAAVRALHGHPLRAGGRVAPRG